MSALGSLVVSLALEHAQFTKGLDKSSQEAQRFSKNTQSAFDSVGKSTSDYFKGVASGAASAVAAYLSVSTAVSVLRNSFDFADKINDVAKANEVAVASVLKLSEALTINGGKAEDASKIFAALTQSIDAAAGGSAETQKRFASLGVSLKDLATLDAQQLFDKTLAGLNSIHDPIKRNAAAMDLLGKSVKGVDIAGLASDYASNSQSFEDAEKAFSDIGLAMDKLDQFTAAASTSLATNFGPILLAIIKTVDDTVFGFTKLEKHLQALEQKKSGSEWKPVPKIGDTKLIDIPGGTTIDLSTGAPIKREVIDAAAEAARRKAEIAAKQAADARKKQQADALALEEKRFEMANDIEKQLSKKALEHAKLVDELAKKNAKTKLDLEQAQFDMSNDMFKSLDKRQLEHEKLVREQQQKTFDKNMELWNSIEGTAHKVWTDVWEGGSKAFKNIGQTIKSAILDLLYQMTFKKWILNIGAVFSATGSGGAAASLINGVTGGAGSASTGGLGLLNAGKGVFDLISGGNAAIVSSIESLGTFLSTGTGGLGDMLGGALGQYAGQISNVLPFAGAALNLLSGNVSGAIGSAIGAALTFTPLGPVGGIIGSFLGSALGGLFGGGKLPPRVGTQRIGNYQNGTFSASQGANAKLIPGLGDSLDNLNETFSKVLGSFFKAFNIEANIGTVSLLAKKKRPEASFQAIVNGVQTGFYNEKFGKKTDLNAALSALSEHALGDVLAQAIRASSVSDGVKKFFDNLTKKEDVLAAVNTLGTLHQALKDLPPVFDAIRNAIETTGYKTSIADLNARFAAVNTYTSLFYTQAEQFDTFTKQITRQFDALGKTLPDTREGFRALVDGINVTDKTTSDLFNGLVALAPAADAYYKSLLEQKGALESISADLFSNSSDYAYASVLAGRGMDYSSQIGEIGTLNRAGDAGLNAVVQALVNAQADTKALLETVAKAVQETARIQKIWNGDGLPETRVI